MAHVIDLVADVGESFGAYRIGDDDALFEILTSANVACGFHAGDPMVMHSTLAACVERGIAVGAHPGFKDAQGFGRRPLEQSVEEVKTDTLYQLGALAAFARVHGTQLSHVTPHGSLGNLCVSDETYAQGVLEAILAYDPTLPVVTQEGELARLATAAGVPVAITAMADRAYNPDGTLVSRRLPGAVLHDTAQIVERTLDMVLNGRVRAHDGTVIGITAHTVLLHGDNAQALETARAIRTALEAAGVRLAPIAEVLATGTTQGTSMAQPTGTTPNI